MAMTLDDFLTRIRSILEADPGPEGRRVLCGLVQEALRDELLMMSLLPDDTVVHGSEVRPQVLSGLAPGGPFGRSG
jgi:hypothetical protein